MDSVRSGRVPDPILLRRDAFPGEVPSSQNRNAVEANLFFSSLGGEPLASGAGIVLGIRNSYKTKATQFVLSLLNQRNTTTCVLRWHESVLIYADAVPIVDSAP